MIRYTDSSGLHKESTGKKFIDKSNRGINRGQVNTRNAGETPAIPAKPGFSVYLNKRNISSRLTGIFLITFIFLLLINSTGILLPHLNAGKAYGQVALRCSICKKNIQGKYWRSGSRTFCNTCYHKYPHCESCGAPMTKFRKVDGKKICLNCYYHSLPRCERCNKPVFRYWNKNGKKYCKDCLNALAEKCALCGQPLFGKFWKVISSVTGAEKKYCDYCKNKAKRCFVCGLPVRLSASPLGDGRYLCADCANGALYHPSQYEPVYKEVKKKFKSMGLDVKHDPGLKIVNLEKLKEVQRKTEGVATAGDKMGYYRCTKLSGTSGSGRKTSIIIRADIFVLDALPRKVAYRVLSHELAHAWHEERTRTRKPMIIMEGFAEWVSYHFLIKKGLKELAEPMKKREDVYGEGLRKMLKIEKERGYYGVLEYVTK